MAITYVLSPASNITYINGATGDTGGTVAASFSISYTPTTGNFIVIGVNFGSGVSSPICRDQNGNSLDGPSSYPTLGLYIWHGTAVVGATSYTISWSTTTHTSAVGTVTEYSGVFATGTSNYNSGTSVSPTISLTTTKADSYILAIFTINSQTPTNNTGIIRQYDTTTPSIAAVDNTVASSGTSVACAVNLASSTNWAAFALELLAPGAQPFANGPVNASPVSNVQTFTAAAVNAGDAILIGVGTFGNSSVSAVSIAAPGWTFTQLGAISADVADGNWVALFGAIAPNTMSQTFTITWTADGTSELLYAVGDEFSGNDQTGGSVTFDADASTFATGADPTVSITPVNNNDAVWGWLVPELATPTIGAEFIASAVVDNSGGTVEYQILSGGAGTPLNVDFVCATSQNYQIVTATIKPASIPGWWWNTGANGF